MTSTNFKVHRDLLRMDNINSKNSQIGELKVDILSPSRTIELADQVYTFLASELSGTYFTSASSTVNRNLTLPSAANIVASIPNAKVGDVITFTVDNTHGGSSAGTKTIVAGAGTTTQGALLVGQNEIAVFDITLQNVTSGSEAVKVIHNLSSSSSGSTISLQDGSAVAPSLNFINDPDTGIYRPALGTGLMGITANGTSIVIFSSVGTSFNGNLTVAGAPAGVGSHITSTQVTSPTISFIDGINITAASLSGSGTDTRGRILCTNGANGIGTVSLTFNQAYTSTPTVLLTFSSTGGVPDFDTLVTQYLPLNVSIVSTTGFTILLRNPTPASAPTFIINYFVIA